MQVHADWDEEARVWVATSDDVAGLATEADTLDELLVKLRVLVPELLELNVGELPDQVPFNLLTRHSAVRRSTRR